MAISPTGSSVAAALQAYRSTGAAQGPAAAGQGGQGDANAGFGAVLGDALKGAEDSGVKAETLSTQAIAGQGNLTDVVSAVSRAELSLQTTIAVRDRVVQAYQDIMRMPI